MDSKNRSILVTQEDKWFVAKDIETNVASQGETLDSALAALHEALELYYEDSEVEAIPMQNAFLTTMEFAV